MPKKGNKRKKTRTHEAGQAPEGAVSMSKEFHAQKDVDNVPRSIVAKTSKVAPMVSHLVKDLRKMMGPYTASHLKEKSYNRMKDFAGMATHLGVTHLLMLSQTVMDAPNDHHYP
jgi:ribosome biogenesis protein SSF1/2